MKILAMVMALAFILTGCAQSIDSFEECVAAGNPVMESSPARCAADGKTFVEDISALPQQFDEPLATTIRSFIAQEHGVSESDVVLVSLEEREWTDGCLGLGQAHESCLMALVSGYEVLVEVQGNALVYRTDLTGDSIRLDIGAE